MLFEPTFGECAVFAGKALTVNTRECQLFLDHMRESVNYLFIDVAQVYRLYMIWELALNAAMGMKRIQYYYLGW